MSKHSSSQSKERSNEIGPCSASLRIEDPKRKLSKKVNVSNPTAQTKSSIKEKGPCSNLVYTRETRLRDITVKAKTLLLTVTYW